MQHDKFEVVQTEVRHNIIKSKDPNLRKQLRNRVIKKPIHDTLKFKLRQLPAVHQSNRPSAGPEHNERITAIHPSKNHRLHKQQLHLAHIIIRRAVYERGNSFEVAGVV